MIRSNVLQVQGAGVQGPQFWYGPPQLPFVMEDNQFFVTISNYELPIPTGVFTTAPHPVLQVQAHAAVYNPAVPPPQWYYAPVHGPVPPAQPSNAVCPESLMPIYSPNTGTQNPKLTETPTIDWDTIARKAAEMEASWSPMLLGWTPWKSLDPLEEVRPMTLPLMDAIPGKVRPKVLKRNTSNAVAPRAPVVPVVPVVPVPVWPSWRPANNASNNLNAQMLNTIPEHDTAPVAQEVEPHDRWEGAAALPTPVTEPKKAEGKGKGKAPPSATKKPPFSSSCIYVKKGK